MDVEVIHTGERYATLVVENLGRRCPDASVKSLVVPDALPLIVDDPDEYLPPELGEADVIIAIHLHPDLLYEIPHAVSGRGTRALIAAIEDPTWLQQGLVGQVTRACARFGIESAFPKPFCALEPASPVIAQLSESFGIGKPEFDVIVEDGVIKEVVFRRGSPCGCTEWAIQRLVGTCVDEDVRHLAAEGLYTYPCLASMAMDAEFGDTIMHRAVALIEDAAERAVKAAEGARGS